MKLLQRNARYQLLLAIPLFIFGTAIGYLVVNWIVTEQVDEELEHQAGIVAQELEAGRTPDRMHAHDLMLRIEGGVQAEAQLIDTVIYDTTEAENIPWRVGRFPAALANGDPATIIVGRSLVETDDLILAIALSMAAVLVLFIFGNLVLGIWMSNKIWHPFHNSLEAVGRFRADGPAPAAFPVSHIEEFDHLNRSLTTMMQKMHHDFRAQKRFTEEAAHELQTPLAVIQGKLDQLIQSDAITEKDSEVINGLFKARERMGRTVNNMLLLARIGNQQFPPATIDWEALFKEQINAMDDLIEKQQLQVSVKATFPCTLMLHPLLAEVLVANLVRNAVQHNVQAGRVNVKIGSRGVLISNTGETLTVDPKTLFDRFSKADPSSGSTGLGLSMVKEICDNAGLVVHYTQAAGTHTLVMEAKDKWEGPTE